MCRELFLLLFFALCLGLTASTDAVDFSATSLLASYEPDEVNDLTVSPDSYWSPTLEVNWPVMGGVNDVPEATEGDYVLKLQWPTNPNDKVQVRHDWVSTRFDINDVDYIHVDVYIATAGAKPDKMSIWDSNWPPYESYQAACVPRWINEWYTICIPIPGTTEVNLDHIKALVFEDLAGESGTIYIDNLRLGPPNCSCGRTIQFSGYRWLVKERQHDKIEPGPNYFTDGPNDVRVDANGHLHLSIVYKDSKWYCSEIIAKASLGYGTYIFTVEGRADILDPNIILGLFTYDEPISPSEHREIDVEISWWPDWKESPTDVNNSQYVVMPDEPENKCRFYMNERNTTTHVFNWQPGGICFRSYYGDFPLGPPAKEDKIASWYYTGSGIPSPGIENPRINFYLGAGNSPLNDQDAEIIITSFQYMPDSIPFPLQVLSPNGSENWVTGTTQDIQWETYCGANISNVLIELSTNSGTDWNDVNTVANTGLYKWFVPEVTSPNCLIRISDANDANIYDVSDNVFKIFECTAPIAGDLTGDCYVDFRDFAIVARDWLKCGNPFDQVCYQWFAYDGHHYAVTRSYSNWFDAEAEAVAVGGHLVTINDTDEHTWLGSTFDEPVHQDNYLWIGFYQDHDDPNYSEPAGGWKWISGEPVTYLGWDSPEPTNNPPGEDYGVMTASLTNHWNDWDPDSSDYHVIRGIIEIPW